MVNGLLARTMFLSRTPKGTADEPAAVNYFEMFRAVEGVAAKIAGQPAVWQFFERFLVIFGLRESHDFVQNDSAAVPERAILARPDERTAMNEQFACRPGATNV